MSDTISTSNEPLAAARGEWLREELRQLRPAYRQAIGMALCINTLGLLTAIFSLQVYDRVVAHAGYNSLVAMVLGMVVVILIDYMLRTGRALLLQRMGGKIEVHVARAVFERLMRLPVVELERRSPSFWQGTFRDIEIVRSTCSGATAMLLIDLPFLLLSLGLIALIAWPVFPVSVAAIIAFMLLAWWSGRSVRDNAEREKQRVISRDVALAELASARIALKSLGAGEAAAARWEAQYAHWMAESLERSRESDRYRDIANSMTTINMVATTSFGALAILSQMMTMGALIAANILAGKLVAPLVQLVGQWRSWGHYLAARKRLDDLMMIPLEREQSGIDLPRPKGVMKLDTVEFAYPGSKANQVDKLAGQLGPNGLHAIIGANGSGKTTLLKLLRGLYAPQAGRVLLDDADLGQFSQRDLSRWIGYLPQHVQLISGTVRDNIALSDPGIDDERVLEAARIACAHDFIVDLPDGYATEMGEAGSRFSGGQRKRIAIAQALLHNPPVLLLDEPTSDLDRAAEQAFIASLKSLAADHTVIVVTHSPALLTQCNGILVMDKGRIAMAGPAAQVLPKLGLVPAAATPLAAGPGTLAGGARHAA